MTCLENNDIFREIFQSNGDSLKLTFWKEWHFPCLILKFCAYKKNDILRVKKAEFWSRTYSSTRYFRQFGLSITEPTERMTFYTYFIDFREENEWHFPSFTSARSEMSTWNRPHFRLKIYFRQFFQKTSKSTLSMLSKIP